MVPDSNAPANDCESGKFGRLRSCPTGIRVRKSNAASLHGGSCQAESSLRPGGDSELEKADIQTKLFVTVARELEHTW